MKHLFIGGISVTVKNLNNTGDKHCTKCGTWLEHWKKHAGKTVSSCSRKDCGGPAKVGAHVKKVAVDDGKHYIVPLCYECNKKAEAFELKPNINLAPATPCKDQDKRVDPVETFIRSFLTK